jgi:glutaminyl-peptide cyclotransferase
MKRIQQLSLFLLTIVVLTSCDTSYIFNIKVPKKATLNDKVSVSIQEENGNAFEKALFFVNGKEVPSQNNTFTLDTQTYGVGKHTISAMVYYGEGKSKRVNNSVEVFSNTPYAKYTYKLVNTYPHDPKAYTQGLIFKDGFLYESTGRNGESTIRKVELKSGKVLQKIDIDEKYFGEGMTILNDKLYFLTWQANKGFIYDPETFEQKGEFPYGKSKQGWGLTHNGTELIKSDGTTRIWFLDPETLKEKRSIQAYYDKGKVSKLNELEYIDGKIYANWWRTDKPVKSVIVVINPENGVVEATINLKELRDTILKTQQLKDDDVLNGIAYDAENNRVFVTGKNWSKLFEIEIIKQ